MASLKKMRIAKYNDIITKNKAKFKAGRDMSRQDFVKLFGITGVVHKGNYKKVHKSNLRLVQAQAEINTLMRESGLYLSSRDYYSEFYVRDKNYTKSTIKRMSSEVDLYGKCCSKLEVRMTQRVKAGTWGSFNKVKKPELDRIGSVTPSGRHQSVVSRLKFI